jgi:hypothetical protein
MVSGSDSIVVLSQDINLDGTLSLGCRQRTDYGVSLYLEGVADNLLLSGGRGHNISDFIVSRQMLGYVLSGWGFEARNWAIYVEEESLDTVGQAVFVKRDFVVPNVWDRLVVVSHDYHIDRVKRIFGFVFGKGFDLDFAPVCGGAVSSDVLSCEKRSLDAFLRTFEGVREGDDASIIDRLYSAHHLYRRSG